MRTSNVGWVSVFCVTHQASRQRFIIHLGWKTCGGLRDANPPYGLEGEPDCRYGKRQDLTPRAKQKLWRTKRFNKKRNYLFNHTALAKVFRAKMLDVLSVHAITSLPALPAKWVVDCKAVGSGEKALVYLGRYLYRGVLPEKNIIDVDHDSVTYRYQDSATKKWIYKTVPGAEFLWRLLQHVLPRRFRRTRNYGFLHPNSKRMIQLIQQRFNIDHNRQRPHQRKRPKLTCPCCGAEMTFIAFRIHPADYRKQTVLL